MSGVALVLGLPHEPPIAAVVAELERLGAPYLMVDQRELLQGDWTTWSTGATVGGTAVLNGQAIDLTAITGVYTRLTSWDELPETSDDPGALARAARLHAAVDAWLEMSPARVVNRSSANDSNNSKPYQALLIRQHFDVPSTLVTNDPAAVMAFRDEWGRIVYKSTSGERSIVTEFDDADVERLHLLANAPVQFQELVPGIDVRVHVVGGDVFATRVDSAAVDYRYDHGAGPDMRPVGLPSAVRDACVELTARLGLELSGIDLRFADDGRVVCFEVNPSPAYIVFEAETRQPIASAIARLLIGGNGDVSS